METNAYKTLQESGKINVYPLPGCPYKDATFYMPYQMTRRGRVGPMLELIRLLTRCFCFLELSPRAIVTQRERDL